MIEDNYNNEECPICFENTSYKIIECNHFICEKCVNLLSFPKCCPLCRQCIDIKSEIIKLLGMDWIECDNYGIFSYLSFQYVPNNDKGIFYKILINCYNKLINKPIIYPNIDVLIIELKDKLKIFNLNPYKFYNEKLGLCIFISISFNSFNDMIIEYIN
jgi:hypothetical protein